MILRYFIKDWDKDSSKAEKIVKEYNNYYKSIEDKLSSNVKSVLIGRHDTHIIKTYFKENNYIMELEKRVWGKANIIFSNATIKDSNNIQDEYWLYDEIYLSLDKLEIHILFSQSDIIIACDDVYTQIEKENYFEKLYEKEDFDIDLTNNNKKNIINTVMDKEFVCGYRMLESWEKLIYSFIQIYRHINYYKYNNIEEKVLNSDYNLSLKEQEELYRTLFLSLEEKLISSIKILDKYKEIINEKELENIIYKFLKVYNDDNLTIKKKNDLYLAINEKLSFDLTKIYQSILQCIQYSLIK